MSDQDNATPPTQEDIDLFNAEARQFMHDENQRLVARGKPVLDLKQATEQFSNLLKNRAERPLETEEYVSRERGDDFEERLDDHARRLSALENG